MPQKVELIVEHYNRTFDHTVRLWRERNTTFLILVAVIALAALLTVDGSSANIATLGVASRQNSLVELALASLGLSAEERAKLLAGLPYTIIHTGLMITVFYLMILLYHRTASIVRQYNYLGRVEGEIRRDLGLNSDDVAFTRESTFYFSTQPFILRLIKLFYGLILGGMLGAYYFLRITTDLANGNGLISAINIALAVATLGVYLGYLTVSKPTKPK